MDFYSEIKKNKFNDPGHRGLPSYYPVPPDDENLLFYIQRNQNQDTIVYMLNRMADGLIRQDLPMHAYWIKYSEGGIKRELNILQNELAYGYDSDLITSNLIRFNFVSYPQLNFYIAEKTPTSAFQVVYYLEGVRIILKHIYVYAFEFGVFPVVKFIEIFGEKLDSGLPSYHKIVIEE